MALFNQMLFLNFVVVIVLLLVARGVAFAPTTTNSRQAATASTTFGMIGGRGWDNTDYLGALSGDDDDLKKSSDDYQEQSESRKAFLERQQELMKSPQARAFLEQREASMSRHDEGFDGFGEDVNMFEEIEPTSGGGSRMAEMMARAKQKQQGMGGMGGGMGGIFEQKMFNLDDDDDEDQ